MSVNEENIVVGVAQDRQVVCLIIEIIICSGPSLLILMEKFWSIQTNYKISDPEGINLVDERSWS